MERAHAARPDRATARGAAVYGFDTGAWVAPAIPPTWLGRIRGGRVAVRPGQALPVLVLAAAAAGCVAVAGYGAAAFDPAWSVLAGLAGVAGLVLALRGFPLVGALALLAAVACWGFVSRPLVPHSFADAGGVARLVAGNLAFAVPLVIGFIAGIWADARRTARTAVISRLGGRRWFGVNRLEPEPQLPGLAQIPSARFFALPTGRCAHLVAAGRRVALVATTVWPRGAYTAEANEVLRNGRPFGPGTDDVDGVVDELRTWAARLTPVGASCEAFLVIHPASERLSDSARIDLPLLDGVRVVPAAEFLEAAGAFLAPGANMINVRLMEALAELYPADRPADEQ